MASMKRKQSSPCNGGEDTPISFPDGYGLRSCKRNKINLHETSLRAGGGQPSRVHTEGAEKTSDKLVRHSKKVDISTIECIGVEESRQNSDQNAVQDVSAVHIAESYVGSDSEPIVDKYPGTVADLRKPIALCTRRAKILQNVLPSYTSDARNEGDKSALTTHSSSKEESFPENLCMNTSQEEISSLQTSPREGLTPESIPEDSTRHSESEAPAEGKSVPVQNGEFETRCGSHMAASVPTPLNTSVAQPATPLISPASDGTSFETFRVPSLSIPDLCDWLSRDHVRAILVQLYAPFERVLASEVAEASFNGEKESCTKSNAQNGGKDDRILPVAEFAQHGLNDNYENQLQISENYMPTQGTDKSNNQTYPNNDKMCTDIVTCNDTTRMVLPNDPPTQTAKRQLSEFDMVELCVQVINSPHTLIIRLIAVHAGITLFNLHRCIAHTLGISEEVAGRQTHVWVLCEGGVYGGGLDCPPSLARQLSMQTDRHLTLKQLLPMSSETQASGESGFFVDAVLPQYMFGNLRCKLTVLDVLVGVTNSHDLLWVPRCTQGSSGVVPHVSNWMRAEEELGEYGNHFPEAHTDLDIDEINRSLMSTRFSKNVAFSRRTQRKRMQTEDPQKLSLYRMRMRDFFLEPSTHLPPQLPHPTNTPAILPPEQAGTSLDQNSGWHDADSNNYANQLVPYTETQHMNNISQPSQQDEAYTQNYNFYADSYPQNGEGPNSANRIFGSAEATPQGLTVFAKENQEGDNTNFNEAYTKTKNNTYSGMLYYEGGTPSEGTSTDILGGNNVISSNVAMTIATDITGNHSPKSNRLPNTLMQSDAVEKHSVQNAMIENYIFDTNNLGNNIMKNKNSGETGNRRQSICSTASCSSLENVDENNMLGEHNNILSGGNDSEYGNMCESRYDKYETNSAKIIAEKNPRFRTGLSPLPPTPAWSANPADNFSSFLMHQLKTPNPPDQL